MPRMSKNTTSMDFIQLRLILDCFARGNDDHCDDCSFVSGSYPCTADDSEHEGWLTRCTLTDVLANSDAIFLPLGV